MVMGGFNSDPFTTSSQILLISVLCDRIFVLVMENVPSMIMPTVSMELPYDGAKDMLLVDNVENRDFLKEMPEAMYEELPAPKKKK